MCICIRIHMHMHTGVYTDSYTSVYSAIECGLLAFSIPCFLDGGRFVGGAGGYAKAIGFGAYDR